MGARDCRRRGEEAGVIDTAKQREIEHKLKKERERECLEKEKKTEEESRENSGEEERKE
jgi:hypothetical protein